MLSASRGNYWGVSKLRVLKNVNPRVKKITHFFEKACQSINLKFSNLHLISEHEWLLNELNKVNIIYIRHYISERVTST